MVMDLIFWLLLLYRWNQFQSFILNQKRQNFLLYLCPVRILKDGFPDTFILDRKNVIVFRKSGGTINEERNKIDYKVLHEWCEKVLND
jgi:hypothetical protein